MPRPKPPAPHQHEDADDILLKLLREQFPGRVGLSVKETCKLLDLGRDVTYALLNKGEPDGLDSSLVSERRRIVHLDSIARLLNRTRAKPKPRVLRVRHPSTRIARDDVQPPAATP